MKFTRFAILCLLIASGSPGAARADQPVKPLAARHPDPAIVALLEQAGATEGDAR